MIHWIDNESAVYSLAKGYSGAADSARVVNLYHACVAQLGVTPWLEYVGTDDNIADLPSRGEYGLLQMLGGSGSFRVAVIPSLSSFVGPLAPLFGAKSKISCILYTVRCGALPPCSRTHSPKDTVRGPWGDVSARFGVQHGRRTCAAGWFPAHEIATMAYPMDPL